MRSKTSIRVALAGLLLVLAAPVASAERVKTTGATRVMKRPGEDEVVVTRVQSGRTLTVIARQGRWMKVRVNGRTGWITRSSVRSAEARQDIPRNTRRRPFVDGRSTRRGWGGDAPEDRIGADATDAADDEDERPAPRKKARAHKPRRVEVKPDDRDDFDDADDEDAAVDDCADGDDGDDCEEAAAPEPRRRVVQVAVATARLRAKPSSKGKRTHRVARGATLAVLDEQPGWMLVEDPDGQQGWIRAADVRDPNRRPPRALGLEAHLGFERLGQVFRSDGTGDLAGYDVTAASAQVEVRASYVQTYGASYLVGADVSYVLGRSTPGIRYQTGTAAADIPYTTHDLEAVAVVGRDLHHPTGAAVFARLGYHYGLFQIADVGDFTKNLAHLPSETLAGVTVGVAAEAPRLRERLGAHLAADYLVSGHRAQTAGLEDGAVSTAKAAWAGVTVDYRWRPTLTLTVGYAYEYAKTEWTGAAAASMRGTGSTEAARKDSSHALLVGLARTW